MLISIASQVPLMLVAGRLSDSFGKKLLLSAGLLMYVMGADVCLIPWAGGFVGIRRAHWMKSM